MKKYGILAYPAKHSQSPEMHTVAFKALGIDAVFERYEIPQDKLNTFFDQNFRKGRNIDGLAVSIPHKETVIKLLDEIDESAEKIGAINTIYWKGDTLHGTNTDWIGFSKALAEHYDVEAKKVLLLGAGGVARAIIFALLSGRVDQVIIASRTDSTSRELAHTFGVQWKSLSEIRPEEYHLVINATPLGMTGEYENASPLPKDFWRAHLTAFDSVYTPEKTQFLHDAEKAGANIISGKNMFIYQGIAQFAIWTGKEAPEKIMKQAVMIQK